MNSPNLLFIWAIEYRAFGKQSDYAVQYRIDEELELIANVVCTFISLRLYKHTVNVKKEKYNVPYSCRQLYHICMC